MTFALDFLYILFTLRPLGSPAQGLQALWGAGAADEPALTVILESPFGETVYTVACYLIKKISPVNLLLRISGYSVPIRQEIKQ